MNKEPRRIFVSEERALEEKKKNHYTEYYVYDSDFIKGLDIYVTETNAYYIDELAFAEVMLQNIYQLDSDIVTLGDWANEFVNQCNAQIDEAEVLFQEYKAIMAELEAKEAELEAKMTALVTSEQLDNDAIASYHKKILLHLLNLQLFHC